MPRREHTDIRKAQLRGGRWALLFSAPVPLIALIVGSVWENVAIWTIYLILVFVLVRSDRNFRNGDD